MKNVGGLLKNDKGLGEAMSQKGCTNSYKIMKNVGVLFKNEKGLGEVMLATRGLLIGRPWRS